MKFNISKASCKWTIFPPCENSYQENKGEFEDWFINIDSIEELIKMF